MIPLLYSKWLPVLLLIRFLDIQGGDYWTENIRKQVEDSWKNEHIDSMKNKTHYSEVIMGWSELGARTTEENRKTKDNIMKKTPN